MTEPDKYYIFGIPYAGGSAASIYGRWARHLPDWVKVVPLELAGHGKRMFEPFHDSIESAVADLLAVIAPVLRSTHSTHSMNSVRYAIYGHSMGTVITYELIKAIAAAGLPPPQTVFLSGRNTPHHIYENRRLSLLSDELLLEELRKFGGTPKEFFKMQDLIGAFLPILRSDYRLIDLYQPSLPLHVTSANIVFFLSDADDLVSPSTVSEWQRYTSGSLTIETFRGGHFFIHEHAQDICRIVIDTLMSVAMPAEDDVAVSTSG